MKAVGAILLIASLTAGCLQTGPSGNSGCVLGDDPRVSSPPAPSPFSVPQPHPPVPRFPGTGGFEISPAEPAIQAEKTLQITLQFKNPDCRSFYWRSFGIDCNAILMRLEEGPGLYWASQLAVSNVPYIASCSEIRSHSPLQKVAPGEREQWNVTWDASLSMFVHSEEQRTALTYPSNVSLAPGAWTLTFGFSQEASYDTRGVTQLHVSHPQSNNFQGPEIRQDCENLRARVIPERASIRAEPSTAPLGSPVTVTAEYELKFPAPGCWVGGRPPYISLASRAGNSSRDFGQGPRGPDCGLLQNASLIDTGAGRVTGKIEFTWNGLEDPADRCQPTAAPGEVTLRLHGLAFGAEIADLGPATTITWT